MKIVAVDDNAEDILICENVNPAYAEFIVNGLNDEYLGPATARWFVIKEDDYVLSQGMLDMWVKNENNSD